MRDSNSQSKYRRESRSQYKDVKDAAHILSLEIAVYIDGSVTGPCPAELSAYVNHPKNFRMVLQGTNAHHRILDHGIIEKMSNGGILTQDEETRARLQVKFLQSTQDECPAGFYDKAKVKYRSLHTSNRRTVWDARYDRY